MTLRLLSSLVQSIALVAALGDVASATMLSGTLRDGGGRPLAGVAMRYETNGATGWSIATDTTDGLGRFRFETWAGTATLSLMFDGEVVPGTNLPERCELAAAFTLSGDSVQDLALPPAPRAGRRRAGL